MRVDEGPVQDRATASAADANTTVAHCADIERARRRLRLHHLLVRRPRWSGELDGLCTEIASGDAIDDRAEPYEGDYWADTHMTLGVPERQAAGRVLAAAGWCP